MNISHTITVFDAADINAESAFWASVLGGEVDADDDWHSIKVDGEWRFAVQLAPDHTPPEWPGGLQQQMHVDLWVEDLAAAHDEVLSLGATLLQASDELDAEEGFQVYADPAGHPFCLCWHTPQRT